MRRLCAFFIAVTLTSPAWGHGKYAWINKGGYTNAAGVHCCGPSDCRRIGEGRYTPLRDGSYMVRLPGGLVTQVPAAAVYPSKDPFARYCTPGCLFTAPRLF